MLRAGTAYLHLFFMWQVQMYRRAIIYFKQNIIRKFDSCTDSWALRAEYCIVAFHTIQPPSLQCNSWVREFWKPGITLWPVTKMVHGAKQHGDYCLSRLEQVFTAHIPSRHRSKMCKMPSVQQALNHSWKYTVSGKKTPFVFFVYLKKLHGYFHNFWCVSS